MDKGNLRFWCSKNHLCAYHNHNYTGNVLPHCKQCRIVWALLSQWYPRVPLGESCLCWCIVDLFSLKFPGWHGVDILKCFVPEKLLLFFLWCPESTSTLFWSSTQWWAVQSKLMELGSDNKNVMDNKLDSGLSGLFFTFIWTGFLSCVKSGINSSVSYFRRAIAMNPRHISIEY